MRRRRWGDNDRHLGPLTFVLRDTWRPWTAVLSSGKSDGCHMRLQALGVTLICELPAIVKPWRRWVSTERHEWSKPPHGYWDVHEREYGFCLHEGHLSVSLGRQTQDSETEQRWGCFLPWTQWRQVYHVVSDGDLCIQVARLPWDEYQEQLDKIRRKRFRIRDHDDEEIDVETYVEQRVWRLGTGWFRWLGYLAPTRERRSLDIRFLSETGPDKGSWKGGLIGTGFEMLPGESQREAFKRYCSEEHRAKAGRYRVEFVGELAE